VSERPAPARLHSLCGTARKLKLKNQKKLPVTRNPSGIPCRPSGIWQCIGTPDRERRMPRVPIRQQESALQI
jgi:hypothetical protein